MARPGRKKAEPVKSHFYCMKCSLNCPTDFFGKPNCEECDYYNRCDCCGRKDTQICEKCGAHLRNN